MPPPHDIRPPSTAATALSSWRRCGLGPALRATLEALGSGGFGSARLLLLLAGPPNYGDGKLAAASEAAAAAAAASRSAGAAKAALAAADADALDMEAALEEGAQAGGEGEGGGGGQGEGGGGGGEDGGGEGGAPHTSYTASSWHAERSDDSARREAAGTP